MKKMNVLFRMFIETFPPCLFIFTTTTTTNLSLLLLLLLILISTFLVVTKKRRQSSPCSKLPPPPGPPALPIIGNLHQLARSNMMPHHTILKLVRKYGPIMSLQLGERCAVAIASAEAAKDVLRSSKELHVAQRPVFLAVEIMTYGNSSMVFAPYGHYWRQLRKMCVLELFSSLRVRRFRSVREEQVWDMIASINNNNNNNNNNDNCVNLTEEIKSMNNNVIFRVVLGNKCEEQETFLSVITEFVEVTGGLALTDLYPSFRGLLDCVTTSSGVRRKVEDMHRRSDKILQDIIDQRMATSILHNDGDGDGDGKQDDGVNDDDVLGVLLKLHYRHQKRHQNDMELTTNQIKAVLMDLVAAGTESTSTTMEWAMAELMKNPEVMKKAQREIRDALTGKTKVEECDVGGLNYLKSIIKETLRLHPPVASILRESTSECEIGGYHIPSKCFILINPYAIGRDPSTWTEPNSFKPERFCESTLDFKGTDFEFIPFGAGRRICPAIYFATCTMELALAQLLYHFDWQLPEGVSAQDMDMTETFGSTIRKKHHLHLTAIPYNTSINSLVSSREQGRSTTIITHSN